MKRTTLLSSRRALALGAVAALAVTFSSSRLPAGDSGLPTHLQFDLELMTMNLTGPPVALPLASDPGNALGDSIEGYGFVNSLVQLTLSSQRLPTPGPATLGSACAFLGGVADAGASQQCDFLPPPGPINPAELHGESFRVQSFFDVFFDITVTDVDARPGRNYAGQPDGATLMLPDTGPADMQNSYTAIFDEDAPNFGLVPPPEAAPYIGHFTIEIPLGGDINGNGENDKIKFTLASHSVGDENRTFIVLPDGTVIDQFDSAAYLEGAVVDESTDPPFTIGALNPDTGLPDRTAFGGPVTASSNLQNTVVPEPSSFVLIGLGLLGLATWAVHRRR